MMLTFTVSGESRTVNAEQFQKLVDVGVRIMKDAAQRTGIRFTIGGLSASAPTIQWEPRTERAEVDIEAEFVRIAQRLRDGIGMLERDEGIPDWMGEPTVQALYQVARWFGDTSIEGISFGTGVDRPGKLTRQTYRTLDRVLYEVTDAVGSVTGVLVTATLYRRPHVTVVDEVYGRGVRCYVEPEALKEAGRSIGDRVVVSGRLKRDYLGRPTSVSDAGLEPLPERRRVTVAEMGGAFEGGPDSVEWLKEQRGR